jgi:hypothetical protein
VIVIFFSKNMAIFKCRKYPIEKSPKIAKNFLCERCNYKCSKQSDFNKHLLTNKHKILQNPTENPTKNLQIDENTKLYFCRKSKFEKVIWF